MRTSKTYFEQIPVETVKKIAKELPETSVVQALDEIAPPQEHWRELAKQIQEEQDPKRMTELVTQLLVAFDDRPATVNERNRGDNQKPGRFA